jgi:hypothetical protein
LGPVQAKRPHLNRKKLGLVTHTSNSRRCKTEGWQSRPAWAKSKTLSPEKSKRAGGVVERLLSKHKALSSNPSTTKKKHL